MAMANKLGFRFRPKLLECLEGYSSQDFFRDLTAGVTVGIVALPLAMAFGIASGVTPHAGLYTAIIAGFLISALGGSRVQIGGPTGAFVVIVYGTIAQYGLENLYICTLMAGVFLVIMGVARLGTMIRFIPFPVTTGFTAGIAVLIFSTQLKDFLGLRMQSIPADFLPKLSAIAKNIGTLHAPTFILAAASLAIIVFWPRKWASRLPGSIVALLFGTLAVAFFQIPVETIGSRFHGIPQSLPAPHFPLLSWDKVRELFHPALTIALLAGIESLLSAVVADGMIDDRHDSNQELIAQGLANLASPLFGGIPATGAIARTATNVKNGGRTPVAGMIHAGVLLLVILVAAPLAGYIPLATLSAVLVMVAFNMGEWHHFARLPRWPRGDAAIFLASFALTVLIDLTAAVEVGLIMAAVLLIKRITDATQISGVDPFTDTEGAHHSLLGKEIPEGVLVFRIFGAFVFGSADKLETVLKRAGQHPRVLILRMRKVLAMDATGLNALEDLLDSLRARNRHLILTGPNSQPLLMMEKAGFLDRLGRENICADTDAGLRRARELLALSSEDGVATAPRSA
jgi:SulP family sulfate permease